MWTGLSEENSCVDTNIHCPDCDHDSVTQIERGALQCNSCGHQFREQAYCPDCDQQLEVLKACGAVDYFCNHCNTLISKRRAVKRLETIEAH